MATDPKSTRFAGFERVPLPITITVGRARCAVGHLAELRPGDVIPLERAIGEPFDLAAGSVRLGRVEPVTEGERVAVKLVALAGDGDRDDDER